MLQSSPTLHRCIQPLISFCRVDSSSAVYFFCLETAKFISFKQNLKQINMSFLHLQTTFINFECSAAKLILACLRSSASHHIVTILKKKKKRNKKTHINLINAKNELNKKKLFTSTKQSDSSSRKELNGICFAISPYRDSIEILFNSS